MMPRPLKLVVLLLSACLIPAGIFAQQTAVRGVIPGGAGADIKLYTLKDYFSYEREVLAETTTDSLGRFDMTFELSGIHMCSLEIKHYLLILYLEPEGEYDLECDSIDILDEYRPMYNRTALNCLKMAEPDPGLNALISRFNGEFNEFISREFAGIYQKRNTNILREFREQSEATYSLYENEFLNQYVRYKIAGVVLAMAPAKKPALYTDLIQGQPMLLDHPEYMAFFHGFYDKHLYPDNRFVRRIDLYTSINYTPDYAALSDSLGKDSTLRNEKVRELVCLNMLGELYRSPDFSKEHVLNMLVFIRSNSKFREHRSIAGNLYASLTRLEPGYPPPAFVLPDLGGALVNLHELEGKPVYINFFTTWSYGCLTELELMKDLYDEYKGRIHFVSISLDEDAGIVGELKEEKGYSWLFLFNGQNDALIMDYRIKTFPVFALLDHEGRLVEYPAYKPSEIIRESFDRLLNKK